mmetsp:Transcript_44256/g.109996  ORF Transcript_44256/g.109996 Transcript_44256/m.109996 type:complete len:92 (+) Transcript_44256:200-475(+)
MHLTRYMLHSAEMQWGDLRATPAAALGRGAPSSRAAVMDTFQTSQKRNPLFLTLRVSLSCPTSRVSRRNFEHSLFQPALLVNKMRTSGGAP